MRHSIVSTIAIVFVAVGCGNSTDVNDGSPSSSTRSTSNQTTNENTGRPTVPGTNQTSTSTTNPGPQTDGSTTSKGTADGTGPEGTGGTRGTSGTDSTGSDSTSTTVDPCDAGDGTEFMVDNLVSVWYVINGVQNPDLNLYRGCTYTFHIDTPKHPFLIKSVQSESAIDTYDEGVTNNGTKVGTITWEVPTDAPDTLYYVCQFHLRMSGAFNISTPEWGGSSGGGSESSGSSDSGNTTSGGSSSTSSGT